jgi:hypothetical protein
MRRVIAATGAAGRARHARTVGAAAVAVLALLAAGCGSGSDSSPAETFVPGATTASTDGSATATTSSQPASRSDPLAQRVFKLTSEPKPGAQQAAVEAIEGYLDGLVTAFATNDVASSGLRRWASTELYRQAQGTVADQVKGGYVLYGPYVFTIDPTDVRSRVGVLDVCVDQHATRRHDAGTDKAGARNDTPYVQLDYTVSNDAGRWRVTAVKGGEARSCPA